MKMSRLFHSCCGPVLFGMVLLAGNPAPAAPQASNEILSALQNRLETGGDVSDLVEGLDDLPSSDLNKITEDFNRAWPRQLEQYQNAFAAAARAQHAGEAKAELRSQVRKLREEFMRVRGLNENQMKKALQDSSWPAMQQLRALLMPTAANVLKKGSPELREQRKRLLILARFRNGLLEATVSTDPPLDEAALAREEQDATDAYSGLDRDGLRILKKNAALAAKEELPASEVKGIRELNEMRLLVGLQALAIDLGLCEASRGHSRDMQEHNFFAHDSPLPGKETPSKRAAKAGTSGGGENIYKGSRSPQAANRGWFFSPGHHKNMFNGGYRRVGLGNHGTHWTQMFGR